MRPATIASAALLAATLGALAAPPAQAANARNPYGNVNPRTDAGNDTGNWQTDRLNDAQLGRNYPGPGPYYPASPPPPPPPRYYPPPGYYPPPPPYYYPPPGYYYPPRY